MKKVKNFWTAFVGIAIALILVVGGLQLAVWLPSAFADADTMAEHKEFNISVQLPDKVAYGGSFTVPAAPSGYTVTVKQPNGRTAGSTAVTADQVGIYTVTYSAKINPTKGEGQEDVEKNTPASYTYYVECYIKNEPQLIVQKSARIPTVVATGRKISNMPGFTVNADDLAMVEVGYNDDKGEWVELTRDVDYTLELHTDRPYGGNTTTKVSLDEEFTFSESGSVFFTYVATMIFEENEVSFGTKTLTKTFETKVQKDFKDTKAPEISIDNMPSSFSVNQKVTLPKATVSDNFDTNPEVIITVEYLDAATGKDVAVKDVKTDKNDIAIEDIDKVMVFDNGDNMFFYPRQIDTTYRVTYKAIDDTESGNPTAVWSYKVTCSDKKAPIMTFDDKDFPSKWGWKTLEYIVDNDVENPLTVTYGDANSDQDELKLNIPFPEFYDNANPKDKSEVTIALQIKDPADRTVVNFSNINQAEGSGTTAFYTIGGTTKTYTFNNTMDGLDSHILSEYIAARIADKDTKAYEGAYTIKYTATDKSSNTSTKTYTIDVSESFADTGKVQVSIDDYTRYLVVDGETDYTLPIPTVKSTTDSKVKYDYTVTSGANVFMKGEDEVAPELKGGETVTFSVIDSKTVMTYIDENDEDNAKYTLEISGDKIEIKVNAKSIGGNEAENTIEIAVKTASKGSAKTASDYFNKINPLNFNTLVMQANPDGTVSSGDSYLAIELEKEDRNYVGVGLGVKNSKGEYLSSVEAETYVSGKTRYVRNVSFAVNTPGIYLLEINVYDIDGFSIVKIVPIDVVQASTGGTVKPESALYKLPETGRAYATVMLNDDPDGVDISRLAVGTYDEENDGTGDYVLSYSFTIKGGRLGLRGNEFTAFTEGQYQIIEKPILLSVNTADRHLDYFASAQAATLVQAGTIDSDAIENAQEIMDGYIKADQYISISDSATVKFELQGRMPTYAVIEGVAFTDDAGNNQFENFVKLPSVAAFSNYRAADSVQIEIKRSNSTESVYFVKKTGDDLVGSVVGTKNLLSDAFDPDDDDYFCFKPTTDGTYTVTYTVKVGSLTETFSYQIKAGDVIAPSFIITDTNGIEASHTGASRGAKFTYKRIKLTDETDLSDINNITFTKSVIGPNGEVVTNSKINGSGASVANREVSSAGDIILEASGKYTVRYEAEDKAGNVFTFETVVTVTGDSSGSTISFAVLSSILIIVGVLLIVGVIVYLVRYRSIKSAGASKAKTTKKDTDAVV